VRYESEYGSNDSTYWLKFELLWREFFKWTERRYGNRIFQLSGLGNKSASDCFSPEIFQSWINGTTGDELTDAVMRELRATGYTSNRGRQNAASYLIHDLGQDWRSGAAWFERQLIDYDPASNYGNWGYIAGVGTDPRGGRKFNTIQQASNSDPDGAFRSFWLKPMDSVDSGT
jgi:deoxyribodipyrimidine photo-lyase